MADAQTVSNTARLQKCYSGAVFDVLRARGLTDTVLPPGISPLLPGLPLAGTAFCIEGEARDDLDPHETLLAWTGMLSALPEGSVGVCQPHDARLSHMGELSAEALQLRGVRGWVVDGGCRDVDFIRSIGFRVFCKYTTPRDVVGTWHPTRLGGTVTIGEVTIRTGDYVLGDNVGIVIIPQEIAGEVIDETEEVMRTESKVRRAILGGTDPQQAYLKYGKF